MTCIHLFIYLENQPIVNWFKCLCVFWFLYLCQDLPELCVLNFVIGQRREVLLLFSSSHSLGQGYNSDIGWELKFWFHVQSSGVWGVSCISKWGS